MAVDLNVSLDLRNLARLKTLKGASAKLAAQSLTFTAERAQAAWRAGHGVFHRRNSWIDRGVRITHATPARLVARVGSIDRYMGRHVEGADEPKTAGGKGLFVPVEPTAQQPTHTRIRSRLRAMARTKTKPFWRAGRLLRRTSTKADAPLKVLGTMRSSVDIRPRLDAIGIIDRAVQAEFPRVYERLLMRWAGSGA